MIRTEMREPLGLIDHLPTPSHSNLLTNGKGLGAQKTT